MMWTAEIYFGVELTVNIYSMHCYIAEFDVTVAIPTEQEHPNLLNRGISGPQVLFGEF